jgi:glycosyltransferase involved in cell wall biosynthesis
VRFLGGVSDATLVDLYRRCEAFVLPSGQEGFGIVFLEAMYFGAPVIAARAKGAVDVVQDGETGLLVAFGDVVGLRMAIDRLLASESLRQALRERARQNVTGQGPFTFHAFVQRCSGLLTAGE